MISSRKSQMVIAVILACTYGQVLAQESKSPEVEPKLEFSNEAQPWLSDQGKVSDKPVKPSYVAQIFLPSGPRYLPLTFREGARLVLNTPTGKSMSPEQKSFLLKYPRDVICGLESSEPVVLHEQYRLYALSREDARKMAEAFIETLTNKESIERRHKADLRVLRQELGRMERRVVEHKNIVMPRKLSSIGRTIGAIEKRAHLLSIEQAKETISELNSILNNLEIELAGVQAKLVVIKQFQDEFQAKGEATNETMEKVEQMFIEQAIQVEALKARKNVAAGLRKQAEDFCIRMAREEENDFWQLRHNQEHLEKELFRHQQKIRDIEEKLALLDEDVPPPKLYQNKVIIYPVRVEE
jgi:hypothetical protein